MSGRIALSGLSSCAGEVTLPGSKSIANRALLMAALCSNSDSNSGSHSGAAPAVTQVTNLLRSDDTERMLEALTALGVRIELDANDPSQVTVHGCGGDWPYWQANPAATLELFLGNAGTAVRPLTAVLAATVPATAAVVITGDARMHERPLAALTDTLQAGHASIKFLQQPGYPPLRLGAGLCGGSLQVDGSASSQYISALLMALPLLADDTLLELTGEVVSWPYIELTLAMLRRFGITIAQVSAHEFFIAGGQRYQSPQQYWVEGDASAASYWLAAAAISGGPLTVKGVGADSIQGDIAFADYLAQMGAEVDIQPQQIRVSRQLSEPMQALDADLNAIPDAAMTFATLALFAEGTTNIRNIANWRIKETDRLHAMATELRKVGAQVVEHADGIEITAPAQLQHAEIATYDDHRMAMCFSLLGFSASGVTILDPDCCRKTYPRYFEDFCAVTQTSSKVHRKFTE